MSQAERMTLPSEMEMASLSAPQLIALVQSLTATIQSMQHRLDWFERNPFRYEERTAAALDNEQQLSLGEVLGPPEREAPPNERQVAGCTAPRCAGRCGGRGRRERTLFR